MQEIGKILPFVFRDHLPTGQSRIIELLAPLWPRVVGKSVAAHSKPLGFESGLLTIASPDPWSTELRALSEQIAFEVNSHLGRPLVKKVRIVRQKTAGAADLLPSNAATIQSRDRNDALAVLTPGNSTPVDSEIPQVPARSYAKAARAGRNRA